MLNTIIYLRMANVSNADGTARSSFIFGLVSCFLNTFRELAVSDSNFT